jgi:hypothetical protein
MNPLDLAVRVGSVLDRLGIAWVLGGSLASSLIGEPRSTLDIDVAVILERDHVAPLVAAVIDDYYISEPMVSTAIEHGSSFNLIHHETGMKVDVFVLTDAPLDRRQMARRVSVAIADGVHIWVGAPEDQILRKLDWFRAGGGVSDRQWRDVVAMVRVQKSRLDIVDLQRTAAELGLGELLSRALSDADGITGVQR